MMGRLQQGMKERAGAVAAILAISLGARLVLAALLDPAVDEAYAMAVSHRWQLSWFDHPPMMFWWAAAMREIAEPIWGAPVPVFVMRLPFVLAFTLTSWLLYRLTERLWGKEAGLWALLAVSLAPFFFVSAGTWIVPDGPLMLFLAMTARLAIEVLYFPQSPTQAARTWVLAGVTLGLAGLSKYHAAFFALGAFGFLLATPHRRHLLTPWPWVAVLMAVLVVSPVIVWNASYSWVSFTFQGGRSYGPDAPNLLGLARAVAGQLLYLGPPALIGTLLALPDQVRADRNGAGPALFLLALGSPLIVFFTLVPLFDGSALPHWQMPGWLFLLPLLGRAIAERPERTDIQRAARLSVAAGVVALGAIMALVGIVMVAPPSAATVNRWGISGFYAGSGGWSGIRDTLKQRGLLDQPGGDPPIVATLHWMDAARISRDLGGRPIVVLDQNARGFAFLTDPRQLVGRDVLILSRPGRFDAMMPGLAPYFTRIDPLPAIDVMVAGVPVLQLKAAYGRNMRVAFPLPYPQMHER